MSGEVILTGIRGCCAMTKRGGKLRHCAQRAIYETADGKTWCYYHNPKAPRKFGEGYGHEERCAGRGERVVSAQEGASNGG